MSTCGWQEIERRAHLTDQQKATKTCVALREAALGSEIDSVKTSEAELNKINMKYNEINRESYDTKIAIENLERDLGIVLRKVADTKREIANQSEFIDDKMTRNGIMAYREILKATVDVFGAENMTEQVICKAIEEAGYGAWRSMMGPKDEYGAAKRL